MSGSKGRRKLVRRSAVLAAVATVLGMATVLAVTGTREPADALKLLTGTAWLGNAKTGTVSQVDGYSGKLTGQAQATQPGDPFQIVQRPDGAYVLDLRTGKLTRISDSTLTSSASRQLTGKPSALQVLTGSSSTWVLDQSSGVLQQVDPTSLQPNGPSVPLGASTGVAVLDADGNPWIPVPTKGDVIEVTPDGLQAHKVGQAGDDVQVEVTASGVWAVDGQAGQALSLTSANQQIQIPQTPAGAAPVAASSPTSPYLPVLVGDQLLDIDTTAPAQSSTSSPAYAGTSQISVVGSEAYLLNVASTRLQTVDLAPLAQGPPIAVPTGSDQLVSKDGLLFVNNADSPQAVVIGANGQATPVSKYTPTTAPTSPTADPGAVPATTPTQAQDPTPASATSGPGGGPVADPGGASGPQAPIAPVAPVVPVTPPTPAPTPTTPTTTAPPSPQAPGQPTLAPVSASGPTLSASWTAPASTGTSAITSYKLIVTPQGSGSTPSAVTVSAPATSGSVSGLTSNSTYCAQVQAVNGAGAGPLSNQECAKTSTDVPGAPGQPQVKLGTDDGAKQSASVSWTAPTSLGPFNTAIASYAVTASPSSGSSVTATATSTSATLSLALGTAYTVTVKAVNADGNKSDDSPASGKVTTDDTPGQVGRPTVTADAAGQLSVKWSAVSANNNQTVHYKVSDGSTSTSTTATTATFTGLTGGKSYSVTVTASDDAGDGQASPAASATPWSRDETTYDCYSTLWHFHDVSNDPNCGNTPGYSVLQNEGATPDNLVDPSDPQPSGAKMLYAVIIGNSTPQNSYYYQFSSVSAPPSGWSDGSTPSAKLGWVFSSSSGQGSVEMCEAYDSNPGDSAHPYFDVYPMGSQPSGCIITFWT